MKVSKYVIPHCSECMIGDPGKLDKRAAYEVVIGNSTEYLCRDHMQSLIRTLQDNR